MSGPSDKARFYLEQAVPQLQEFKSKKIFSEEEIKGLVKKRTDFEHKILSRGCQPVNFARYAAWEIGLERLLKKRCKRLGIKKTSFLSCQAKIIKIFDRGTKRHPGDLALWMSYLEYVKGSKSNKKFKSILTEVIRLHPTKSEFWLYAAKWCLESEVDINGARSYMQRGIRFCPNMSNLWIEYAKIEMIYLAKIEIRRKILKLDEKSLNSEVVDSKLPIEKASFSGLEDMIPITDITPEISRPVTTKVVDIDSEAANDPMKTPALNGAIPMAIFDAARKQTFFCSTIGANFFDMFTTFSQLRCLPSILQHVTESMLKDYPVDPISWNCFTRNPLIGVDPLSSKFPPALGFSLARIKESLEKTEDKPYYTKLTRDWAEQIMASDKLDSAIRNILQDLLRKLERDL